MLVAEFFEIFKFTGREQATMKEMLDGGCTGRQIAMAVYEGRLCKGVAGYWLPRAPDPGFLAVISGQVMMEIMDEARAVRSETIDSDEV